MTTTVRLAIVAGVLLLAGCAAAFLVPSSADGYECGNAVAPEWDEEESRQLAERSLEIADSASGFSSDLAMQSAANAASIGRAYSACSDSLGTRATVGWSLLAGAIVVPGAIVFVGRGVKRA